MDARPLDSNTPSSPALPAAARVWGSMGDVDGSSGRLSGSFAFSEPVFLHCESRRLTGHSGVPTSAAALDATAAAPDSREVMGPRRAGDT